MQLQSPGLSARLGEDAFTHFPGSAELSIKETADKPVEQLCKLMPRLSDLKIRNASKQLDLSPLGSCSHLTMLRYEGDDKTTSGRNAELLLCNLSLLPETLRELELEAIKLDQESLCYIQFSKLTKLTFLAIDTEDLVLWKLLQSLPALKVAPT